MKRALPRLVAYAAAGAALFLIGGVFAPWWVGSDQSLANAGGLLLHEMQRREALDNRDEVVRRCLKAKERITAEVVAGRLSLTEAAAAFQEWNETVKDGNDHLIGVYRGAADEEAVCRNVIVWAKNATKRDPERHDAVLGRLEEELNQFLRSRAADGL